MLDTYSGVTYTDAQADAVAQLMWHCGANANMKYTLTESSASMADAVNAMTDVFNYPTTRIVYPESRTVKEWEGLLRAELDASCPVLYEVERMTTGHVFVFMAMTRMGDTMPTGAGTKNLMATSLFIS